MWPKMAQDAFKEAQDGPKSAEDRLKMATIALQEGPNRPKSSVFHWCVFEGFGRFLFSGISTALFLTQVFPDELPQPLGEHIVR